MARVEGRPLYRRIEADLRARIRTGELAPGAQVETELELMDRYGVSRATVRQALGGLIAAGALEVRRGLGTYVASARFEHTIGGFYSFSREIERGGRRPGTRVLGLTVEPADEAVAEALEVAARRAGRGPAPDPAGRRRADRGRDEPSAGGPFPGSRDRSTSRRSGCTTR